MEARRTLMNGGKEEVRLRESSRGELRALVEDTGEVADASVDERADEGV